MTFTLQVVARYFFHHVFLRQDADADHPLPTVRAGLQEKQKNGNQKRDGFVRRHISLF